MGGGASKAKAAAAAAAAADGDGQWMSRRDLPAGNPAWSKKAEPQLKGIHPKSLAGVRRPRRLAPSQSAIARPVGADAPHNPSLPKRQSNSAVMENPKADELVVMASAAGQDPVSVLNKLKDLLDTRVIDQSDYDKRKHQLLDRMMKEDDEHASTDPAQNNKAKQDNPAKPPVPDPAGWVGPANSRLLIGDDPGGRVGPTEGRCGKLTGPPKLLKAGKAWFLPRPISGELDPWEAERWWEGEAEHTEVSLNLTGWMDEGVATVAWLDPTTGEQLGELRMAGATLRRTTSRPRGQGTPGFLLQLSGQQLEDDDGLRVGGDLWAETEFHIRMSAGVMAVEEFEGWVDALGPYLAGHSVGVSLRFLQRFVKEHPEIVSDQMTTAQAYAQVTGVAVHSEKRAASSYRQFSPPSVPLSLTVALRRCYAAHRAGAQTDRVLCRRLPPGRSGQTRPACPRARPDDHLRQPRARCAGGAAYRDAGRDGAQGGQAGAAGLPGLLLDRLLLPV